MLSLNLGIFAGYFPENPTTTELFPDVIKISDDLYVGKVRENFYLAMERIDASNIDMWKNYAQKQETAVRRGYSNLSLDGIGHFILVLDQFREGIIKPSNELWVAYASNKPVTKKTDLNLDAPLKNPSIEMFVTVISSPEALLTSHMGISRTVENFIALEKEPPTAIKHPYQSVDLHSFAAKVMKIRDPRKKYMLTAPAIAMRNILIKRMPPNSVFVGDDLYQKRIEAAENDPMTLLGERELRVKANETPTEREERLQSVTQKDYKRNDIKEKFSWLKTNPPRIIRTNGKEKTFLIQNPDRTPLVTFDQSSPIYQFIFTEPYRDKGILLPYILIDLDMLAKAGGLVPLTSYPLEKILHLLENVETPLNTLDLLGNAIKMGLEEYYFEAILIAQQAVKNQDPDVRIKGLDLFGKLVEKGCGHQEASDAALQAIMNSTNNDEKAAAKLLMKKLP